MPGVIRDVEVQAPQRGAGVDIEGARILLAGVGEGELAVDVVEVHALATQVIVDGLIVGIEAEDLAAHLQWEEHALDGDGHAVGAAHAVHKDDGGAGLYPQELGLPIGSGAAAQPQRGRAGLEAALAQPVRYGIDGVEGLRGKTAEDNGAAAAAGGDEAFRAQSRDGLAHGAARRGELLAELGLAG